MATKVIWTNKVVGIDWKVQMKKTCAFQEKGMFVPFDL